MILILLDAFIMTGFGQQVMLGSPDSQTRYYSGSYKLSENISEPLISAGVLLSNETQHQIMDQKEKGKQDGESTLISYS